MKQISIIFLILLSGCVTEKKCTLKFPPQTSRDSVYIEKVKEVPYLVKGDTVTINVPVDCPDQNIAEYENGKLKQTISILNGRLSSVLNIKPDTIKVPYIQRTIVTKEVKVPNPVKYVPKIYKYSLWFSIAVIILIGLYIYKKIK